MKTKIPAWAVASFLFVPWASALAQEGGEKIVYIKSNEVFTSVNGKIEQVTRDGKVKMLPVWSRDGSALAFVEGDREGKSLGDLVVINESGKILCQVRMRAVGEFAKAGGMRFIESLEWLDRNRIAVSGSANPSLTETQIANLLTHTTDDGYFDDGPGTDFSPDGQHFAYFSGSPHFTPGNNRQPVLNIDGIKVYPERESRVRFLSARSWSPDSGKLAVIVEDVATLQKNLVVWSKPVGIFVAPLPLSEDSVNDIFWDAGDVVVSSNAVSLRFALDKALEPRPAKATINWLQQARQELDRVHVTVTKQGGREVDIWCRSCSMANLPRKVSVDQ
jgi:hypothetical protein